MSEPEEEHPSPIEEIENPRLSPGPVFSPEEHRARTTSALAFLFFAALFVVFAAHVTCILVLAHNKPNSVDEISRVFNVWVPIFSGSCGRRGDVLFHADSALIISPYTAHRDAVRNQREIPLPRKSK
jgi:hypothetical protein